ncbi:EAL domain-containing protein [Planococcus sp. ISL-109]|uniref:bifunctional diguanylate cyclase/phosphodiesterase n=1 Tax=Planococcus sp. ISL-109 TaxID=2819166 RepID=UPI001BE74914|nr:EAL domain-containing protein [Planococcus sp. ISL-109]MBT2583799.1 EAL domain-containing protein [Planococcus sp. ISL-109]
MHQFEIQEDRKVIIDWLRRLGIEFHTSFVVVNPEVPDHPIAYANDAFFEMTGYIEEEVIGENGKFLHGTKTDSGIGSQIREATAIDKPGIFEIVNYRKDGTPFWNEITVQPLLFPERSLRYTLMLQRDISDRKRAETLIELQKETYKGIEKGHMLGMLLQNICEAAESFFLDGARCTALLVDEAKCFQVAAAKSMPEEFIESMRGLPVDADASPCGAAYLHQKPVIVADVYESDFLKERQDMLAQFNIKAIWSMPIFNGKDEAIGSFGIYFPTPYTPKENDLSFMEEIASIAALAVKFSRQQEEVLRLAYIDEESGLPNRHYFRTELNELLKQGKEGFVAFLSADEFLKISDQYGHRAGNDLSRELGRRLVLAGGPGEKLVARFSDSRLAFYSTIPLTDAPEYLEHILSSLREPMTINEMDLFLTIKVGVAIVTPAQQNAEELIRCADSALSKAKERIGESIFYFENEQDEAMMRDLRVANALTVALKRKEISVYLQPKVALESREILGFEALARWKSPDLGDISPAIFIPAAEKNGKIRQLEQHVIEQVLSWLKKRQDQGMPLRQVAINISADHFFHHSFVPYLVDETTNLGISPKWIQLEITERIGVVDIDTAGTVFAQLKKYGFATSIDDFGTGYSSLSYLQKLPVEEIKIDRSFISNIDERGTRAVIRTIIQLADNLGLRAVAEGVETEMDRTQLLEMGCTVAQGFLFHRPMPIDEAHLL